MGEEAKRAANKHSKSTVAGARNSIKNTLEQSELPSLVIHVSGAAHEAERNYGDLRVSDHVRCGRNPGGSRTFSLRSGTRRGRVGGTPGPVRRLGQGAERAFVRGGEVWGPCGAGWDRMVGGRAEMEAAAVVAMAWQGGCFPAA